MSACAPAASLSGFDLFWVRYPNKFGRDQARAAWDELAPSAREQEAIFDTLLEEAADDLRILCAGGSLKVTPPPAAVWLYRREFSRYARGRALAQWRGALDSPPQRTRLAMTAGTWMVGAVMALALAAGPAWFVEGPSRNDAQRVARVERVIP